MPLISADYKLSYFNSSAWNVQSHHQDELECTHAKLGDIFNLLYDQFKFAVDSN